MAVPPLVALQAAGTAQGGLQKALTGDLYVKRWTTVEKRPKSQGGPIAVDHELHVNPLGVAIAGAVGTLGLGALALGAYIFGVRAKVDSGTGMKRVDRIVDIYDSKYETVTITDFPAQWNWVTVNDGWVEGVVLHDVVLGYRCKLDGAENTIANPVENSRNWYAYHTPHGLETLYGDRTTAGYMKTHKEYQMTAEAITHTQHRLVKSGSVVVMTKHFRPTGRYKTLQEANEKMVARYTNATGLTPDRAVDVVIRGDSDKPIKIRRIFCHFTADGSSIGLDQSEQRTGFL